MSSLTIALTVARHHLDWVFLATALAITVLALLVPAQAVAAVLFTLQALASIAPFFALSVLVAASAKASGVDRQIATVFSGQQVRVIVVAAVFGAFSPFCSCGVVPIIAALLKAGVPLAPVMAFWVSSPLMDPEMFILMAAEFELTFVIAKATAALLMGLVAGFITQSLARQPAITQPLKRIAKGCSWSCSAAMLENPVAIKWAFWRYPDRRVTFLAEARTTGWFLLKWLTLAFVVESLMVAYVPANAIAGWLGGGHWWVIPASAAVGVPAYLNGYAAIPTVSALIEMGMAPAAGLTFMVAGGVTSIPAAMAVFALVKWRVFALYLLLGLVGSILVGFVYQAVTGVG